MGCDIAWRRFPLTSATGAATVSQPQCRDAPKTGGTFFFYFQSKRKLHESTFRARMENNARGSNVKDLDTFSSVMAFLSIKRGSFYEVI